MADNVGYTPGTGSTIAADEIDGVLHQRIKLGVGEDGVAQDVSSANPLPAKVMRAEDLLEMLQRLVKVCETLQVVDSAQRQRIVVDAALPAGGNTIGAVNIAASQTLGTVTTVSTVTNVASNAGMDREQYINIAKQTYTQSIRNQLKFQ